jgi:hypothetical protein
MEAAHSFRLTYKKNMSLKNAQKPTSGIIWIAKSFPPWQSCVIDTMRELYEVSAWVKFHSKLFDLRPFLVLEKQVFSPR